MIGGIISVMIAVMEKPLKMVYTDLESLGNEHLFTWQVLDIKPCISTVTV